MANFISNISNTGFKTIEGGEIFGDYENNQAYNKYATATGQNTTAASKGYFIKSISGTTVVLEGNAEDILAPEIKAAAEAYGLENSVSIQWGNVYDFVANVAIIEFYDAEADETTITLEKATSIDPSDSDFGVMWFPTHPHIGNRNIGETAFASGKNSKAIQLGSHAEGQDTIAASYLSHTEGEKTVAGYAAHAEGRNTKALGNASHAEGSATQAKGTYSHSEGVRNVTTGVGSHAEGIDNTISGRAAHGEGEGNTAAGKSAHVEGKGNTAKADFSHVEGLDNTAEGYISHIEGRNCKTAGSYAHAQNRGTQANGNNSTAAGYYTIAGYENQFVAGKLNKNKDNTLFEIGNGTGSADSARSNAFEVYKDGHAVVGKALANETDLTVATKGYVDNAISDASLGGDASVDLSSYQEKFANISRTNYAKNITIIPDIFENDGYSKETYETEIVDQCGNGLYLGYGPEVEATVFGNMYSAIKAGEDGRYNYLQVCGERWGDCIWVSDIPICGLAEPTESNDAATKNYVDTKSFITSTSDDGQGIIRSDITEFIAPNTLKFCANEDPWDTYIDIGSAAWSANNINGISLTHYNSNKPTTMTLRAGELNLSYNDSDYDYQKFPVVINGVANPTADNQAANKAYVDSRIVISSTTPTNPVEGQIWIEPII